MQKIHFSYCITALGVDFVVRGESDQDGRATIDTVEVADSIVNIWPAIDDSGLADVLEHHADKKLARELELSDE